MSAAFESYLGHSLRRYYAWNFVKSHTLAIEWVEFAASVIRAGVNYGTFESLGRFPNRDVSDLRQWMDFVLSPDGTVVAQRCANIFSNRHGVTSPPVLDPLTVPQKQMLLAKNAETEQNNVFLLKLLKAEYYARGLEVPSTTS
jgi:hypothetical protein